MKNTLEL